MQARPTRQAARLAPALLLLGLSQVGCQAERPVLAPIAPDWSYHDGGEQLSNNDAWQKMIPASAFADYDASKLASVEDSTQR